MQPTTINLDKKSNTPHKNNIVVLTGVFLIIAGVLLAAHRLNAGIPYWLVSWPAGVIAIGLLIGVYHRFRAGFWLIPVCWGSYLMAQLILPELHLGNYATALSFIIAGVIFLLIKRRPLNLPAMPSSFAKQPDVSVFAFAGNAKRDITSQDFSTGEVISVLGNTVADFRKADIQNNASISVIAVMSSAKIFIPDSWTVRNDITTVFGDIKHNSDTNTAIAAENKIINFTGIAIFGAIEIISCRVD